MGIISMSFAKLLLVLNSVLSLWYDSTLIVSRLINSVSEIETRTIDMRNNMRYLVVICFLSGSV